MFPQGVAVNKANGDFFVSSSEDGTVVRGNVGRDGVEVVLPGGRDGRTGATGPKVDPQGRLWTAGRYLLTVHFAGGRLFRIDTRSKKVLEVDLGGQTLRTGDGLLLDGTTLLAVREQPGAVFPVRLSDDLSRGTVGEPFGQDDLDLPTTLAEHRGEILVVNSQFDRNDSPELPFTVTRLPLPDNARPGAPG